MMRSIYIVYCYVFFFKYTASTEIYTYCPTLSLHDALPICLLILAERFPLALRLAGAAHIDRDGDVAVCGDVRIGTADRADDAAGRSEEHTSELQSLMRISYAVFCLKKKKHTTHKPTTTYRTTTNGINDTTDKLTRSK